MTGPIRLEPVYLNSIWAGNRLGEIRGLKSPGTGISREVCTYPGSENRVCNGPFEGQKITELIDLLIEIVVNGGEAAENGVDAGDDIVAGLGQALHQAPEKPLLSF